MTDFTAVDFSRLDQSIENICGEVDRLRAVNRELLAALKAISKLGDDFCHCDAYSTCCFRLEDAEHIADAAIAHAERVEP